MPDNNEWSRMRKMVGAPNDGLIKDASRNAMMQDTASKNSSSYTSYNWTSNYSYQTYNKNNKNNGYYTPVLEIPAGADIHPVTVDLGGGSVDGKGTLKLAVVPCTTVALDGWVVIASFVRSVRVCTVPGTVSPGL